MASSIRITPEPFRVRAALTLRKVSVRRIALKNGAAVSTVYAALAGKRPGNDPKVQRALAEMDRITKEALRD